MLFREYPSLQCQVVYFSLDQVMLNFFNLMQMFSSVLYELCRHVPYHPLTETLLLIWCIKVTAILTKSFPITFWYHNSKYFVVFYNLTRYFYLNCVFLQNRTILLLIWQILEIVKTSKEQKRWLGVTYKEYMLCVK